MEVLLFLIPMALVLGLLGLGGFLWSLKSGQFDDLDGAAHRALFDDAPLERDGADGGQAAQQDFPDAAGSDKHPPQETGERDDR